jgi:hypothetical protein
LARQALVNSVPLPGNAFSTSGATELGLKMTKLSKATALKRGAACAWAAAEMSKATMSVRK